MMLCDVGSIYVLKTMEFLDFGGIFRGAERAIYSHVTMTFFKQNVPQSSYCTGQSENKIYLNCKASDHTQVLKACII